MRKTIRTIKTFLLIPLSSISLVSCVVNDAGTPGSVGEGPGARTNEEQPSTEPVPQKVIDDCLAELKTQIPDREMKVMSARRGEASFIVDVEVAGVPEPWRCYHDGTKCSGTVYQGEG